MTDDCIRGPTEKRKIIEKVIEKKITHVLSCYVTAFFQIFETDNVSILIPGETPEKNFKEVKDMSEINSISSVGGYGINSIYSSNISGNVNPVNNTGQTGINSISNSNLKSTSSIGNNISRTNAIKQYISVGASSQSITDVRLKSLIKQIADIQLMLALLAVLTGKDKDKTKDYFAQSLQLMLAAGIASVIKQNMEFFMTQIQQTRVTMQQELMSKMDINVNSNLLNQNLKVLDSVFMDTVNQAAQETGPAVPSAGSFIDVRV